MIIAIFLFIALVISLIYTFSLKKDLASIVKTLQIIKKSNTNMRLRTTTFDKDICQLSLTVNQILDQQQQLIIESERTNREFRQGITNISHDLRTPLTSVIGYLQMIKSNQITEVKKREYLETIERRLKSLTTLMKELFEYTQIVEDNFPLNIGTANIGNLLRDEVLLFYEAFTAQDFHVKINIPDQPVYAKCDAQALKRIAQNLIQNALTHGIAFFELSVTPEGQIISRNQVAEINNLEVERLFERFYTADASRSSKTTGLGLAITKELVDKMDGQIKAEIQGERLMITLQFPQIDS